MQTKEEKDAWDAKCFSPDSEELAARNFARVAQPMTSPCPDCKDVGMLTYLHPKGIHPCLTCRGGEKRRRTEPDAHLLEVAACFQARADRMRELGWAIDLSVTEKLAISRQAFREFPQPTE